MFDLQSNAKGHFVIFAVEPSRMKAIAALLEALPHKWLLGSWKDKAEFACIVRETTFLNHAGTIMQDQSSYLHLGDAWPDGTRPATLVKPHEMTEEPIGRWRQTDGPIGDSWTFDPSTGFFYHAG